MGRGQADPSPSYYQEDQAASNTQPQDDQYYYDQQQMTSDQIQGSDITTLDGSVPPPQDAYNDINQSGSQDQNYDQYGSQDQNQNYDQYDPSSDPSAQQGGTDDTQTQQQTQPPPPFHQPPQPQPQAYHPHQTNPPRTPPRNYPPQGNPQVYPPQAQPMQFPPQPVQFPPSPAPPSHQANYQQASQPVQFPPQPPRSHQANYQQAPQPVQFPPQSPSQATYHQPSQPVQYPPAKFQQAQMPSYSTMPPSPLKPAQTVQTNCGNVASGIPVQNMQYQAQQVGTEGWKTGLFDCLDDPTNAIITAFFPCFTFGQIAEIVDNGTTSCATSGLLYGVIAAFIGLPCLISCSYRTKLRSRYGLLESPAPDWLTHCVCEPCALCQEYRELQHRGLDPSIGWIGNLARNQGMQQQQQVATRPPMNQTMMG